MGNKEKDSNTVNNNYIIGIVKALIYTIIISLGCLYVLFPIFAWFFPNMSGQESSDFLILSFLIGIIFTILHCTFIIIEEINQKK